MNERDDAQLESLLREHLAGKLDGQLGRAAERFTRAVGDQHAIAQVHPHMRLVDAPLPAALAHRRAGWRTFAWSMGLAGAAVAAGIAVVMIVAPMATNNGSNRSGGNASVAIKDPRSGSDTMIPDSGDTLPPSPQPVALQDVEHALSWDTVDQGTVYLGGELPLRSVVRRASETVRWYDPQRKAHVEMTVPRDQVMLVGYGSQ